MLNRFTLIQFKGPTDALQRGDLAQLVGCTLLWHGQQDERISNRDISLLILAPTVNEAARDELQFRRFGEDFAMQHQDSEYLAEVEAELRTAVLEAIPPEERLRGLPPEERLRGLPPEERLRGVSFDDPRITRIMPMILPVSPRGSLTP